MKTNKTACILLISLFSFNVFAQEPTMKKEEDELKEILSLIEGKLEKSEKSKPNQQNKLKNNEDKKVIRIEQYTEEPTLDNATSGFQTAKGEVQSYDHVYLLNVPIQTKLYATKDIYIYPYRDGIIYKDGQIVNKSPLEENVETTFCYINVAESGTIRRFKSSEDKFLTISNNYSSKQVFSNEKDEILDLYQTTFYIDNEHIESIRCLTTEKKMPMTIGDMKQQMGNMLKFKFPEIIDI